MQNTAIQWTDHTVNFWWGCTKVSRACQHCYAESVAKVFGKRLFGAVPEWGAGKPRFERLQAARKEALKIQRRAAAAWENWTRAVDARAGDSGPMPQRPRVFVNSMSDWLDDEVPLEWLAYLLETLAMCPNVDFQLLTKRPENWKPRVNLVSGMYDLQTDAGRKAWGYGAEWYVAGKAPENLWIGCTVEDQKAANTRIPHLLTIPAKVRFLSCEPLVGPIVMDVAMASVRAAQGGACVADFRQFWDLSEGIHWIIAGGESGGQAAPSHPDWFRSLRDQCAGAGVAFFFKQWGEFYPQDEIGFLPAEYHSRQRSYKGHKFDDGTLMLRVGVDTAGALLDGVPHLAFPQ